MEEQNRHDTYIKKKKKWNGKYKCNDTKKNIKSEWNKWNPVKRQTVSDWFKKKQKLHKIQLYAV